MNTATKYIISFVSGGLIGAAISFFVTRRLCEKQATQILDQIRDHYKKEAEKEKTEVDGFNDEEDYTEFVKKTQDVPYKKPEKVDYAHMCPSCAPSDFKVPTFLIDPNNPDLSEDYDPDEVLDDGEYSYPEDEDPVEEELVIEPIHKDYGDDPEPYIITEEEYFTNDGLFSQDALTFYEKDGVIADDHDETVDPSLIGIDNIALLEEEDTIYVKNFTCGMKWEINKCTGSYYEMIKGSLEHPKDG